MSLPEGREIPLSIVFKYFVPKCQQPEAHRRFVGVYYNVSCL